MKRQPDQTAEVARADMRVEVVKRELNQGALAGFRSEVTDSAALMVVAALDSFDQQSIANERRRIRRSLALAVFKAVRCIPDGPIRNGCVTHDGAKVREALRQAWLSITEEQP